MEREDLMQQSAFYLVFVAAFTALGFAYSMILKRWNGEMPSLVISVIYLMVLGGGIYATHLALGPQTVFKILMLLASAILGSIVGMTTTRLLDALDPWREKRD